MILPTRHLPESRALIQVGAQVLSIVQSPKTVSSIWEELKSNRGDQNISFDWFILSLDLLRALGTLTYEDGRLRRDRA